MASGLPVLNSTNTQSVSPRTRTFASALRMNSYFRRDRTRRTFSTQVLTSISSPANAGSRYSILCSRTTQVASGSLGDDPANGRIVFDGDILHPLHIGYIIDVTIFVNG